MTPMSVYELDWIRRERERERERESRLTNMYIETDLS